MSFVLTPVWLATADISAQALRAWVVLGSFGTFDTATGVYESIHPAVSTICDKARMSESTFHRAINELIGVGALERIARVDSRTGLQIPNAYRLITGDLKPPARPGPPTDDTPRGTTDEGGGVSPVAHNPEPLTHNQKTHKEPAPATQSPTKANEFVALLIEACKKQDLVLPPRIKGMYAKKFKELLDGGMPPELILEALRLSWKKRTLDKVQLLDNLLVEVQAGERVKDVRTKQEVRNEGVDAAIDRAVALVVSRGGDPNNGRLVSKAMKEIRLGLVNVGNALTGGMRQMELVSA